MIIIEILQNHLKLNCDPRLIGLLSLSIKEAYRYLDDLIQREIVLQRPEMKKSWGHIRHAFVDVGIKQVLESSKIPHEIVDKTSSKYRNGHTYLMIELEGAIITPSKVRSANEVPRKATFRNKGSVLNKQYDLFMNSDDLNKKYDSNYPPFLILTYGGKDYELEFINLGLPAEGVRQWVDIVDIMNAPVIVSNKEEITQDLNLTFTESAEEIIKRGVNDAGEGQTI